MTSGPETPAPVPRWSARVMLPGDDAAPRAARRLVSTLLLAWGYRGRVELVELLASELVSNAVGRSDPGELLELELWADEAQIRVSVADSAAEPPPNPGTDDAAFRLVERIADDWAVEDFVFGYRVWAVVAAADQPADASGAMGST